MFRPTSFAIFNVVYPKVGFRSDSPRRISWRYLSILILIPTGIAVIAKLLSLPLLASALFGIAVVAVIGFQLSGWTKTALAAKRADTPMRAVGALGEQMLGMVAHIAAASIATLLLVVAMYFFGVPALFGTVFFSLHLVGSMIYMATATSTVDAARRS